MCLGKRGNFCQFPSFLQNFLPFSVIFSCFCGNFPSSSEKKSTRLPGSTFSVALLNTDHYFRMMQIENWAKFLSVQKKWFERDEVRLKASLLIMRWKAKEIGARLLSPFSCPWVVFEMVIQRSMSNIWLVDFTKMKHRIMMIRIWLESLLKMFWLKL